MAALSTPSANDPRARVRFAGKLCMHCTRNLAFHHATGRLLPKNDAPVWRDQGWVQHHQFWLTTISNFLDVAVLEWCKLFGNWSEKHHWRKIVSRNRQDQFKAGLLVRLRMTENQFQDYRQEMLEFRDKFVAHLDTLPGMQLPHTLPALRSVAFLYHELLNDPATAVWLPDAEPSAAHFYRFMYRQGQREYRLRFSVN